MQPVNRFTIAPAIALVVAGAAAVVDAAPIRVAFLWHMHQPIYYPGETVIQTQNNARFSFNVLDIHNQRFGPYTTWPKDAVQSGSGLSHLGASVSFTGSLIENLNAMQAAGVNGGMWNNWTSGNNAGRALLTSLANPRLDLVAFGYFHPMMPLLDQRDIRMQVKLHKQVYANTWTNGASYAKGIFPPECAFSERIIPALAAEGIEWAMVDNIHFDRACLNYPHTNASNLYTPNKADQQNPDPAASGGAWVQLNNLWAPSKVSAPFGYRPHKAQYIDPATGLASTITAVPAARYEGNEDGRGGYGAFLYSTVMNQYIAYNTDATHPMLVLLHHDGDNYGGGTDAYYHSNFQSMVNWDSGDANYESSTIQDYLQQFPPAAGDVIHVENGSWAGADNGDPEFKKWLGDPNGSGWSPDRNSWAVLTAAGNRVHTAEAFAPYASLSNILSRTGSNTEKAWGYYLMAQASDYWYWDGSSEPWDSNVTRACNLAMAFADPVVAAWPNETVGPDVFIPQRDPYNPGGEEFGTPQPSDFTVWTYAYDVSGLQSVTLKWRTDLDGINPIASAQNETYAGGAEVSAWTSVAMTAGAAPARPANILAPTYIATYYSAQVTGQTNKLIDFYVEALDSRGNLTRSDIQHVWVGQNAPPPPPGQRVTISPATPAAGGTLTVSYDAVGGPIASASPVRLHYGFNNWTNVNPTDPSMTFDTPTQKWVYTLSIPASATQFDCVFNNGSGTWDNNSGADWHFAVTPAAPPPFTMDGQLDAGATQLTQSSNTQNKLWVKASGNTLYIACPIVSDGNDRFIYVAGPNGPGAMVAANWAKAGQIALWDAFLAAEIDNSYFAWADTIGSTQAARGAVLEGTLNLKEEFNGVMPARVYLAAAAYATPNAGALVQVMQAPPTVVPNGSIEASEYIVLNLNTLIPPPNCAADINRDGAVNTADLTVLLGSFGSAVSMYEGGDLNGDGVVNTADLTGLLGAFGVACP